MDKRTMTGMPAFKPEGLGAAKAVQMGIPPSPQGMARKITITGPVVK
jgi:hypothetical protein